MLSSPSNSHDFDRLRQIDRRLRLQNAATRLEILIGRSSNPDSIDKLEAARQFRQRQENKSVNRSR